MPTLTSAGWISDPINKLSRLFDYFLTTEKSQSYFFKDNILSFQEYIKSLQHDPVLLASRLETSLGAQLNKYFDTASVAISSQSPGPDGRYDIKFDIVITENNTSYSLGRVLEIKGSEIVNISDTN